LIWSAALLSAAETSPADSAIAADLPAAQRSKVTNGRSLFVDGDGRGPWARRLRDLMAEHARDLGGLDALSSQQASLVRRAATITVELEKMEGRMSKGDDDVSLDEYARVAGHLRRILETLGIGRKPRNVTPSMREYLAGRARQAADATAARREASDAEIVEGHSSPAGDSP
jgi:hypothetical protein